jgi:hypothetical protein
MGFLKRFKSEPPGPPPLPNGSFCIDKTGQITTSTVPRAFPEEILEEIARRVLLTFRNGKLYGYETKEITVTYDNIKIRARELRGGAMVFFHHLNPH